MIYDKAIQNGFIKLKEEIDSRLGSRVILKSKDDININELLKIIPASENNSATLVLSSFVNKTVNLQITLPDGAIIIVEGNWQLKFNTDFIGFALNLVTPIVEYNLDSNIDRVDKVAWRHLDLDLADKIATLVAVVATAGGNISDLKMLIKMNFGI